MNERIGLDDWNWATLMATQALIGLVSPNFRHVVLRYGEDVWTLSVTLSADDREDRPAVEEIVDQLSIYRADLRDRISARSRNWPLHGWMAVARRAAFGAKAPEAGLAHPGMRHIRTCGG